MFSVHNKNSRKSGFTLIELLVVVAIISLLTSITLASLSNARKKSRYAVRLNDITQVRNALELYYTTYGHYPVLVPNTPTGLRSECNAWGGFSPNNVIPGLVPTFMSVFPSDPQMDKVANVSCYIYLSNGTGYKFIMHDGPEINSNIPSAFKDPIRPTWAWMICSGSDMCAI
jgi:prepilin-type N-terminal cleavage/methylation domain-containing protein